MHARLRLPAPRIDWRKEPLSQFPLPDQVIAYTTLLIMVLLTATSVLPDVTSPVAEDFETHPFSGGRWTAVGNAQWSTEQSFSPTHSLKLSNNAGWQYFT